MNDVRTVKMQPSSSLNQNQGDGSTVHVWWDTNRQQEVQQ